MPSGVECRRPRFERGCPWTPVRCLTFEPAAHRPPRRPLAPVGDNRGGKRQRCRTSRRVRAAGFQVPEPRRHRHHAQARRSRAGVRRADHPGRADPAAAARCVLDLFLAISITLSILILMTVAVHPGAAGILRLSDRAADLDHAAAVAQPGLDPADPVARPRRHRRRRPRHRGVRQFRDGRQFRHRHHRVRHPGDRELRGHHQGLRPHRRSRRALPPGRHARQADGDRRRPLAPA